MYNRNVGLIIQQSINPRRCTIFWTDRAGYQLTSHGFCACEFSTLYLNVTDDDQ